MTWGDLQLAYTLAPMAVTAAMLDSPVMADPDRQPGRHGMNLATRTVRLPAERLPARRLAMIPHPRAAALALAVRRQASRTRTGTGSSSSPAPSPHGWIRSRCPTERRRPPCPERANPAHARPAAPAGGDDAAGEATRPGRACW